MNSHMSPVSLIPTFPAVLPHANELPQRPSSTFSIPQGPCIIAAGSRAVFVSGMSVVCLLRTLLQFLFQLLLFCLILASYLWLDALGKEAITSSYPFSETIPATLRVDADLEVRG